MNSLALISPLVDIGRSLREGAFMFWETLWALVLGFALSGIVQAFVSKEQMKAKLGNHRPAAVSRAAGYGVVSSSCSYAASAMAKSLFAKGADFVSSMIFMVASTNLVVELGVIMLVLLGWQFMAAEFVGGPIMIILLALTGGYVFRAPLVERVRARLRSTSTSGHDHAAMSGVSEDRQELLDQSSSGSKVRSLAAWSDAASYSVADATMLRRELVIGFVVAGFLAVLVPGHLWNAVFLHGNGVWTEVENALVGPLIAVVSWVCSIGNVPLAAALWSGGISFGGVIAFIFADLIAMPLILIYRKLYGTALTVRIVGLFYVVMVVAGLATGGIFNLIGAIPTSRHLTVTTSHFAWNVTTYLDFAAIAVAVGIWWLSHNKLSFGGGKGYAIDPVCGMQVRTDDAPAQAIYKGEQVYFCSDRCKDRFIAEPERFISSPAAEMHHGMDMPAMDDAAVVDPVCGMTVSVGEGTPRRSNRGVDHWFCSEGCAHAFEADPSRFGVSGVSEGETAQ